MMIRSLGRFGISFVAWLGAAAALLWQMILAAPTLIRRFRLLLEQLYAIGVQTLLIIAVSGLFVGMVMALQFYLNLSRFGAESELGLVVALTLVRELGPVLTALLFAGRAGSALTAEVGLMKATEQLDAMEMMAVDPVRRVLTPRFWAGLISVPLLTAIFIAVGVLGGHLIGVDMLGVDPGSYWGSMQSGVDVKSDVVSGLLKSVVFGFVVTLIALYEGYAARPTSEGVARATTRTVVTSCLSVLGLDYILTALMFGAI
ncbi:lipid asymmetry maintenance ABC transporter permease subunit MlaE [Gammaproteobacteria bacterium]|nr:lipid asymmetry maintenance ABC transporter permease subunit MlaE [Gammaproteobacteria bacterium]